MIINIKALLHISDTLKDVFNKILIADSSKISAFNKMFSGVMEWYYFISQSILNYGTRGYVYEYSTGRAVKDNFFNTFWGYGVLLKILNTTSKFIKYTLLVFMVSALILCIIKKSFLFLIFVIIAFASPFFIYGFVHCIKPENFAWLYFICTFFFINQQSIIFASIFCFVSLLFSITVFVAIVPVLFILYLLKVITLLNLIIIVLPAFLYLAYQLIGFLINTDAASFFRHLDLDSQSKDSNVLHKILFDFYNNIFMQGKVFLILGLLTIYLFLIYITSNNNLAISLVLSYIYLLMFNMCIFRFADSHTFVKMGFCIIMLVNFVSINLVIFVFSILLLYLDDDILYSLEIPNLSATLNSKYPYIEENYILSDVLEEKLDILTEGMNRNDRIVLETNSYIVNVLDDIRLLQAFLTYYFGRYNISVLPEEWFGVNHKNYIKKLLTTINISNPVDKIIEVMNDTGANIIMAYTSEFKDKLFESDMFKVIGEVKKEELGDVFFTKNVLKDTVFTFFLLKKPCNIVEGCKKYILNKNQIIINANPFSTCIIKLNYHSKWKIMQGDGRLSKIDYKGLNYMKIEFKDNNINRIEFLY